jgi:hypothetical protein
MPGWPATRSGRALPVLLLTALLSTGALSAALRAPPGALTAVSVAASGTLALLSVTLAARILAFWHRAQSHARRQPAPPPHPPTPPGPR